MQISIISLLNYMNEDREISLESLPKIPPDVLQEIQKQQIKFYGECIPSIKNGILDVRTFCEQLQILDDESAHYVALSTPNFNEYKCSVSTIFPNVTDDNFEHERMHAEVAQLYKLHPHFELLIVEGRMIFGRRLHSPQLLIQDYLGRDGIDWDSQKLLQYLKEVFCAPGNHMSETDRQIFELLD